MRQRHCILSRRRASAGFTLIEIALVVLIVGVLLGGLMMPLSAQVQARRAQETGRALEEIREALIGFALINGRLPCPDTDDDPTAAGYGEENAPCSAAPVSEGFLPWRTLGVSPHDAWGSFRTTASSPRLGDWRYRVDRTYAQTFALSSGFSDNLEVKDSAGTLLTIASGSSGEHPVAVILSAGPNTMPDGDNGSFDKTYQGGPAAANFDDMTIWISRPVLVNRMVAAGKLP